MIAEREQRFREMRYGVIQMMFTQFPGYISSGEGGILEGAWWRGDCDDEEAISDAAMRLVDWALDSHPQLFGLSKDTDYNEYNTLSVSMAGWIGEAASTVDDRVRVQQPDRGPAYGDWYEDVEIHPGVVVRVMFFRRRTDH